MMDKLDDYTTDDLIKIIRDVDGVDRKFHYEVAQALFKRWRKGIDLDPLVELLQSEKSSERLFGAYCLGEVGGEVEGLKAAVIRLAHDPLSYCRYTFVATTSSDVYDTAIFSALAKCLLDLDVFVRVAVIKWAIDTSDERFEEFCRLVELGTGRPESKFPNPLSNDFWIDSSLRRGTRGLDIIRRIRGGEEILDIRRDVPEEDSFVFDSILFSETGRERLDQRQKAKLRH